MNAREHTARPGIGSATSRPEDAMRSWAAAAGTRNDAMDALASRTSTGIVTSSPWIVYRELRFTALPPTPPTAPPPHRAGAPPGPAAPPRLGAPSPRIDAETVPPIP